MDLTNLNRDKKNRRKTAPDLSTMIYGKVPPHARDLEDHVLGAIMLHQYYAYDLAAEILKPTCFYVDSNQRIFTAIQALANKSQPLDARSVVEELRSREELDHVGGPFYVLKLTNEVVNAASVEHHSKIVYQKYIQREIIRIGGLMISDGYEDSTDPFQLLDECEQMVLAISTALQRNSYETIDSLLVKFTQKVEERRNNKQDLTGVTSGFKSLDRLTHGWQETDLIILAARPSVGKTAFALNLARNAAMNVIKPVPVAFFSLEMSAGQLINRLVSSESGINLDKIQRGDLEEHEMKQIYTRAIQSLSRAPIFIDDSAALNIFELRAKARRLKNSNNIGMIIVDYLQLMSGTGNDKNREQEISHISRGLKALGKELQIPVIALSQLSREPEKRQGNNKMPQLSDLRESGAIEQDADVVVFLYRPEYYGVNTNETGDSNVGETKARVAKNRNGVCSTLDFKACLWIQKFLESEDEAWKNPGFSGGGIDFKKLASGERSGDFLSIGSQLSNPEDEDPF